VLLAVCLAGGEGASPARAEEPTTKPAAPASLLEAEQVIDLRRFPMLESSEMHHRMRSKVGYVIAKPDLAGDVQFYRTKLTEAGWKIEKEDVNADKHSGILSASKGGFRLAVSIVKDPNDGKMGAFVENLGNVDAQALPHFAGARPQPSQFNVAHYTTDGKVDAVADFLRGELTKLGWRRVGFYGGANNDEPDLHRLLMFVQRGTSLTALIDREGEATRVMVQTSLMKYGLPIMPQATGIELMEEPFVYLGYATKAPPADVLTFYRKELPPLGWTVAADEEKGDEGAMKVKLSGPDKEALRLEVLGKEGVTFVLLAGEGM